MIWVLFVLYFYVLELVIKSESFDLYCSWECFKEILVGDWTDGILCSIGMPVIKGSERYNCQVLCFNRKIIMIRPKCGSQMMGIIENSGGLRHGSTKISLWTFSSLVK